MRRVVWLTDIHLNFLSPEALGALEGLVRCAEPDAVLLGGDIDEAPGLTACLRGMAQRLPWPIYFVLGNHDFYRGSITVVRREVAALCRELPQLTYLTDTGVVELTPHVGLVGHDGWADGRAGDYERSDVFLNDYFLIEELAEPLPKDERLRRLNRLGDEAAEHVRRVLPAALQRYPHVLVLTHVPPFLDACWHEGQVSDDNWSPHFTCVAMGEAICEAARCYPQRQITVLCGHTHGAGEARIGDNIHVLTGGAEYGRPEIQRVLELE
jgi:predicted phosphohydrolase